MKPDPARQPVKRKVKNAVITLADQPQVVIQFFAGVAGEVADLCSPLLRNDFEQGDDIQPILRFIVPERLQTGDISFPHGHKDLNNNEFC
jgi:hypothetical protein